MSDMPPAAGRSSVLRRIAIVVIGLVLLGGLTALSLALLAPSNAERCDPSQIMPAERCPLPSVG